MFITRTTFTTDPTQFIISIIEKIQPLLVELSNQDLTFSSGSFAGLGGGKKMSDNPMIIERTFNNVDIARTWITVTKEHYTGSGLSFVSTIEEILWTDDTHTDYSENPVKLEII